MNINAIYPAFDGEVNAFGIGAPTIFVRAQGCHLRCYLKTKGVLCDTPEALEKGSRVDKNWMTTDAIMNDLSVMRATNGISKVTFSGGDPLARPSIELHEFFVALEENGFDCTVETSGTLSIEPFRNYKKVHWVLDYKLKSCGIEEKLVQNTFVNVPLLNEKDYIKFVVETWADYVEFKKVADYIHKMNDKVKIAVGLYWGSDISNLELFNHLVMEGLTEYVQMNFQVHKLIINPDFSANIPARI